MPDDQRRPHVQRTSQVLQRCRTGVPRAVEDERKWVGSKSTICTLKGENPKKLKITAQYK